MEQAMQISGANKLAERIVEDARADARTLGEESAAAVAAVRAECEKTFAAHAAEQAEKRASAVNGVLEGARTRAQLSGRKTALAKKRAMLEACFAQAGEAVQRLSGQQRKALLRALLAREREGGETIIPAAADREALTALLSDMGQAAPVLSTEDAPIAGGFVLRGEGYEKDCSLDALLAELWRSEETKVAGLLFD